MKTKLLPSLSEGWEELYLKVYSSPFLDEEYLVDQFIELNDFLKQEPKLYMFVPCDKDGNVLEKPPPFSEHMEAFKEWQQALERVIFDGFEVVVHSYKNRTIEYKQMVVFNEDNYGKWSIGKYKTLADLSGKVEVNSNGIKNSGL